LDPSGLATAHWQGATGLDPTLLSYSELHNAGTKAAQLGRFPEAEQWFNEAIRRNPDAAISWLARGIARGEQGKKDLAAQDLAYASELYGAMGDLELSQDLHRASESCRRSRTQTQEWQWRRFSTPEWCSRGFSSACTTSAQGLHASGVLSRCSDGPGPGSQRVQP